LRQERRCPPGRSSSAAKADPFRASKSAGIKTACPGNTVRVRRCQTSRYRQIDRKQQTCLPVSKPAGARLRGLKRNECKTRSGYESLLPWPLCGLRNFLVSHNEALELLHVVMC